MGHSIKAVLTAFDAKADKYKGFESSYRRIREIRDHLEMALDEAEGTLKYQANKMTEGFTRLSEAMIYKELLDDAIKGINKLGYSITPIDESIDDQVENVRQWAINKSLDKAEPSKQMLKVVEETGEVAAALARGKRDDLRDGIGDVIVTLIILAEQNDMTIHECLEQAYGEIADRKGQMVDGVFVKDGD